jgi:hypothetical protein
MSAPDAKLPNLAALLLILIGLLIGVISGLGSGSIAGGVVAALAMVPACWGMWAGVQSKESQAGLGIAILLFLAAAGVGGLLILLRFVDWLR